MRKLELEFQMKNGYWRCVGRDAAIYNHDLRSVAAFPVGIKKLHITLSDYWWDIDQIPIRCFSEPPCFTSYAMIGLNGQSKHLTTGMPKLLMDEFGSVPLYALVEYDES